jgi:hypothetical protein
MLLCTSYRLEDTGFGVGLRLLEMLCFREKSSRRDIRLLDILKFVHTILWKYLFGRQARDLEQSNTVRGWSFVFFCKLCAMWILCHCVPVL